MCFSVKKKMIIATKNITSYKYIRVDGKSIHFQLKVGGKPEPWKEGYHYTEALFPKAKTPGDFIYGSAFHSFKTLTGLRRCYRNTEDDPAYKVIQCTIPKGASYYENNTQYCSSDIIYRKDLPTKRRKNA